ncbi:aspartate aminotransferase family protein [Zavarzinia compransoris]|uniref:Glutamate-1-semialdehyde 2,1-aminomutase n=1 Tax=Zavarzinia compransoris TaxID=1264899 RepID=A0A317E9S5_9PROT|nr:glutamate-1-semialdehyde 2,1-aminomutase [Zavarzinia compransoris]PWR23064.1 aspartate aminotransferase family protein [Zavarzinia compransoris]TDP46390.1 glutamate-1-semialdehyde 2,1-aminomutase [Zavarzinia compransoris]
MNYFSTVTPRTARSAALFDTAARVIPGGVNSTARAQWAGWTPYPLFVTGGTGAWLQDVDGNRYVDYLLGLGPMILGHRPPAVTDAVVEFIRNRGTVFALPTEEEAVLAEKIIAAVPSVEQVRLCNTGTEAVLYATRLARAFTRRSKIVRFEGMYHGFSDAVYWSKHPRIDEAGPDHRPRPVAQGPGLPKGVEDNLIILPWNDAEALAEVLATRGDEIAAVLMEPVMCNTGCILPQAGYLEAVRDMTGRHGVVLIFDEVITGFRLGLGGAQGRFGILPDLSVFAKGLGGGFPVAALGGRREIMALVADGTVSMAGTYTANGIAVAAANAALDELSGAGVYDRLDEVSDRLRGGLGRIFEQAGLPAFVVGLGPLMQVWFSREPIANYRDAVRNADQALFRVWWENMLARGVLFHPGAYENLFVSTAHGLDEVELTLQAARESAADLARLV